MIAFTENLGNISAVLFITHLYYDDQFIDNFFI
mgnify:CR=1 FL=1|jgi:hypothetical protein